MFDEATIRRTMLALHADAHQRGMLDLAMVYGWSAIRLGNIILAAGLVLRVRGWRGYR